MEPWLVTGAALYWGAIVLSFLFPGSSAAGLALGGSAVNYLVLSAFVAAGFVCPRAFLREDGRLALLCAMAAASVAAWALPGVPGAAALAVAQVCHLFAIAVLMVLWGFAFASMDKRTAGENVTIAMLAAVAVILVGLLACRAVPVGALTRILMLASAAVLLCRKVRFRSVRREHMAADRTPLVRFALSRCGFGAMMGLGVALAPRLAPADAAPALVALGLAVVACALVVCARRSERLYFALPTLLLLTMGAAYLPFFEEGLHAASGAAVGLMWLAWAEFSAFQLSDLKERCGTSELSLCLAEKALLSLAMAAGSGVGAALGGALPAHAADALDVALFAGACACALGATYVTGCLVGERAEDRMRAQLAQTRRQHTEAVYDAIAAEHGLSAREREVMGMLAEGYTRAYIRDALSVSDGTAKAHIAHVYAKLDIHRKDDLLEYIDRRVSGE